MLGQLRVDVEAHVPLHNPYHYRGTADDWDNEALYCAFAKANMIEVHPLYDHRSPLFSGNLGNTSSSSACSEMPSQTSRIWGLKVAKAGILNRKDDLQEGGKKAGNRKWKPWSAILTGSQLLLFRDPLGASNLLAQSEALDGQELVPTASVLKPDELLPVNDSVAVFDDTYTKACQATFYILPLLTISCSMNTPGDL
jgi:hypothetical protein